MEATLKQVGENIKLYRKAKGYTLEAFAHLIGKSKSSLSKYENGVIAMDLNTLFDICSALDITINHIMQQKLNPSALLYGKSSIKHQFFKVPFLYTYQYDGLRNRLVNGVIYFHFNAANENMEATLYWDIPSKQHYTKCTHLYYGFFREFDSFSIFTFANQNTALEQMTLTIINPNINSARALALACGISCYPMMPFSVKCVLSHTPLSETDLGLDLLKVTKDELQYIKKNHRFIIKNISE